MCGGHERPRQVWVDSSPTCAFDGPRPIVLELTGGLSELNFQEEMHAHTHVRRRSGADVTRVLST